jgi:hypothetical protein
MPDLHTGQAPRSGTNAAAPAIASTGRPRPPPTQQTSSLRPGHATVSRAGPHPPSWRRPGGGLKVRWNTLEALADQLAQAKVDGTVTRTVAKICQADIVVIDDIGDLPIDSTQAEAFYRIHRLRLRAPLHHPDQQHQAR